jgi:K+-sensing histidine kinase KdpD
MLPSVGDSAIVAQKSKMRDEVVSQRLSQVYLPNWFGFAPVWVTQAVTGLTTSAIALVLRSGLELAFPGVVPFALLFPATLIATLLSGWQAGAWATLSGGLWTWYVVFPPQWSLILPGPGDIVNFALYAVASAIVAAFAEAYRRSAVELESSADGKPRSSTN